MHETLPALFATKPRAEWLKILRDLDIPVMPDLKPGEIYTDPQVLENQLTCLVELENGESVRVGGAVVKFSESPSTPAIVAERKVGVGEALQDLATAAKRVPPPKFGKDDPARRYPLAGLKVIDFGVFFAGPFASRLLADLGAEVIKIENLAGCPMREISKGRYFQAANHYKRTMTLNLKKAEARPIIERLVKWADVVQHNLRPGVAELLGMGYESLRDLNSRMIYCHSPAFGSIGPYRGYPGFEPLASAITGLMMRHAGCQYEGPRHAIGSMDPGNGLLGAAAILMALYHRDRTGEGQYVECPQLGSGILSTLDTVMRADESIVDPLATDADQYGFSWFCRLYECSDAWLVVHAWSEDTRQALRAVTGAAADVEIDTITKWAAARTVADAVAQLRTAGVPVEPIGLPYKPERYFFEEENVRFNRVIEFQNHPRWGRYRDLGQFWRFSTSPVCLPNDGRFVPPLGANTREILAEHGFNASEIESFIAKRVVSSPADKPHGAQSGALVSAAS